MRDPKRIERILNLLRAHWRNVPDQRLGQVIINLVGGDNVFYTEDDLLEIALRREVDLLTQIAADVRSGEMEKL